MSKDIKAYCCECGKEIEADIVGGDIIYPHRKDLYPKKFYMCPHCHNYTGVYQGEEPVIPTKYIRECRHYAHRALDRIWHNKKLKNKYYAYMNEQFKKVFHWGEVRSEEEATKALEVTMDYLSSIK
jgi:hypothetical protein